MARSNTRRLACQLQSHLRQLATTRDLPFANLVPIEQIRAAAQDEGLRFRDRLFSPWLTLWVFLSQVLDADHCCRQAVKRLLAFLTGRGLRPCAEDTSG